MQAPLIRKGIREQVQGIGMWERVQAAAGGWMGGLSASLKRALSGGAEVGGAIVGEIAENIDVKFEKLDDLIRRKNQIKCIIMQPIKIKRIHHSFKK